MFRVALTDALRGPCRSHCQSCRPWQMHDVMIVAEPQRCLFVSAHQILKGSLQLYFNKVLKVVVYQWNAIIGLLGTVDHYADFLHR